MNTFKVLVVIAVGIFVNSARASEGALALYIECAPNASGCQQIDFPGEQGQKVLVPQTPDMVIGQDDIAEAKMEKGEYGQDELQVSLRQSAADKFALITGKNIARRLVIVVNGKALIAPTIQSPITGGRFNITRPVGSKNDYLDDLPWLKEMTEKNKISEKQWSLISIIAFIVLGIVVVGGSVYFAFVKTSAKPQ
jgi:hypothetical protein